MNLRHLGFPQAMPPMPRRVPAAAPRSEVIPTPAQQAHVVKLLAACLNLEDSARALETTPHFSGQLQADLVAIRKASATLNLRMMKESHQNITAAIDTLNARGNLLNQFALLLASAPEDIALAAMQAAANEVERLREGQAMLSLLRPARRRKTSAA